MSETKHTPGPWRICTTGNLSNVVEGNSGRPLFDGDAGFRPVAMFQSCCSSQMYAVQEANALANGRMISAAPDLLEALEGLVLFSDEDALYRARAAIAKATEA